MVSELCLGCMTFGRELDEEGSRKIIARFLDAGANFIDTADVYSKGVSEEITGRAIKGSRDEVVLATKVRFPMGEGPNDVGLSRKHVISGCEASLQRLGTDYIDLYQVHTWDALTPLEETLSALTDLIIARSFASGEGGAAATKSKQGSRASRRITSLLSAIRQLAFARARV